MDVQPAERPADHDADDPPASRVREERPENLEVADPFADLPHEVEPEPEGEPYVATWAPVDLSAILAGDVQTPVPTMLTREDGVCLLYPGLTHSIHGESESGKSMVCQIEAARLLAAGEEVVYVDFESDPAAIVERLRLFGATDAQILAGFRYLQPEVAYNATGQDLLAWDGLLKQRPALVVIDGVTEAINLFGYSSNDNDELTKWGRMFPRRIADATGAAVVMVDHVTKSTDGRGRFAIGGQAKLAMITGAAYSVEVEQPLGRGLRGVIRLMVGKDRPGYVRGHAGPMQGSSRTQEAARVIVDSLDADRRPEVRITAPDHVEEENGFRPTGLMTKVSKYLETSDGASISQSVLLDGVGGTNRDMTRRAIDMLVVEGYVSRRAGPRNAKLYDLIRPFRNN